MEHHDLQFFERSALNRLGERTACRDVQDPRAFRTLPDWVPAWCFACIRWALRNHGGRCPLKLDWFAARGLRSREPVVIHELREGRAMPLSDHDPIGVEILA
ncbi:MAG: hypothetical protein ACE15B_03375 [Bryobacteraceae bacterium]